MERLRLKEQTEQLIELMYENSLLHELQRRILLTNHLNAKHLGAKSAVRATTASDPSTSSQPRPAKLGPKLRKSTCDQLTPCKMCSLQSLRCRVYMCARPIIGFCGPPFLFICFVPQNIHPAIWVKHARHWKQHASPQAHTPETPTFKIHEYFLILFFSYVGDLIINADVKRISAGVKELQVSQCHTLKVIFYWLEYVCTCIIVHSVLQACIKQSL